MSEIQETKPYTVELVNSETAADFETMGSYLKMAVDHDKLMDPKTVARLYKAAKKVVEPVVKALEERVRTLADEGADLPGIKVGEPSRSRRIVDAGAAYNALADVMEPGEFAACCTVRLSALERALVAAMRRDDPGAGKGEAQALLAHKGKDADWMSWDERRPAIKIVEKS